LEPLEMRALLAGTWTALANGAPNSIGTMELLTNGTVMAQGAGVSNNWYSLTPDSTGSYVNGTWSSLANMSLQRLYTATNVLKDGRVFELGGEYSGPNGTNNWINSGEIYNPVSNSWSSIPNFPQSQFGDDPSMQLPDGRVLVGYLSGPQTYIYDPVANSWSQAATKLDSDRSDEETWVKLPDDSILTYDVFNTSHAQRYIPSTNQWVETGTVPVALSSSAVGDELGPAFLLPDGRVFYLGANGNTAFYTPSTDSWTAGPVIPGGGGADDAPGAMLPNGDILFAADTPEFHAPTKIYEFNPTTNVYTDVTPGAPNLSGTPAYVTRMLMLPTGQALFTLSSSQLYVYTPSGGPQTAWQPTVTSVAPNGSNYTLTGTQINGISAGASYGDDAEMDTNYPIIELKSSGGTVYFARTFNWSSTGVATGATSETTDFSLPSGLPNGTYSLTVVGSGISSSPFQFTVGASASADVAVTATGPTSPVPAGTDATYTIVVSNNGPDAAPNFVLSDALPAGSQYVSLSQTAGTDSFTIGQSGGTATATATSIPPSSSDTFSLVVFAPSSLADGANFSDTATVSSGANDPNTSNNTATVPGTISNPQSADLVVTNTGPGSGTEGGTATYTIGLANNGPSTAPGTVLTDTLGANMKFVSATTNAGTYSQSGGVVTFNVGSMNNATSMTATVTVQFLEDGNISESASATSNVPDPNTGNNTAPASTNVTEVLPVVSGPITTTSKKLTNIVVATFTHSNGVEPTSAFTAMISWGDGKTSPGIVTVSGGTYTVTGSHNYTKNVTHTISTTVTESGNPPGGQDAPRGVSGGDSGAGRTPAQRSIIASGTSVNLSGTSVLIAPPAGATGAVPTFTVLGTNDSQMLDFLRLLGAGSKRKPVVPQGPLALTVSQ
jgi:uncharacterized repeat protein (TIGR01451 family)